MSVFVTSQHMDNMRRHVAKLESDLAQIRHEKYISFRGDTNTWHDNFAYESLTRQEKQAEKTLLNAKSELDSYEILTENDIKFSNSVGIFCRIHASFENIASGIVKDKEITIVPLGAQDYTRMIYNYNAPMILPLMGANVGDERTITIPIGTFNVTILSVKEL